MKKAIIILAGLLLVLNMAILTSGKTYLYPAIIHNFADIDDHRIFPYRTIAAKRPQPWLKSKDYNKNTLTPEERATMESWGSVAYLVIRNDSILFEEYWEDYDENSRSSSFSMAKTFVSALVGVALREGKIHSIDQPVSDFLPSFKAGEKSGITIRHLLTMSSGIDWDESYANPLSVTTEAYYGDCLPKLVEEMQVREEPGKNFDYVSGNTLVLAEVLQKATGMSLSKYLSTRLWIPMGAGSDAWWSTDKQGGMEKAYCCIASNARDFARLGKLYKDRGRWKGVPLVPEKYVAESVIPAPLQDEGKPLDRYGYSWWLLTHRGQPVFYARGILGQYIFIMPEKDLVVVRLGHRRSSQYIDGHPADVWLYLDAASRLAEKENV